MKAISQYAGEASSGRLDDALVMAAMNFIRDWTGDTYEVLAEMMGRPKRNPQKLNGRVGESA